MKILGMKVVLIILAFALAAVGQSLPKPEIRLVGVEDRVSNGYAVKAYEIEVVNRAEYSNDLFMEAPVLPPCGQNANAARAWINIYGDREIRLQGWCNIKENGELASLRFNLPADRPQPKTMFINLIDRLEGIIVRSNTIKIQ
jgi:hypothetical protein